MVSSSNQMFLDTRYFSALGDLVLIAHLGVVFFNVGGLVLILGGARLRWKWVRNLPFRLLHLAASGYPVVAAWFGIDCGLTVLEQSLRLRAGQTSYEGDFIAHWVSRILFYESPPWVFITVYTAFGLLVVWSWIVVRPHRNR